MTIWPSRRSARLRPDTSRDRDNRVQAGWDRMERIGTPPLDDHAVPLQCEAPTTTRCDRRDIRQTFRDLALSKSVPAPRDQGSTSTERKVVFAAGSDCSRVADSAVRNERFLMPEGAPSEYLPAGSESQTARETSRDRRDRAGDLVGGNPVHLAKAIAPPGGDPAPRQESQRVSRPAVDREKCPGPTTSSGIVEIRYELSPHATTLPSRRSARQWSLPAVTATTSTASDGTAVCPY